MRVIKPAKLTAFIKAHPACRQSLLRWYAVAKVSRWASFQQMREVFRDADEVRVKSGKKAVIFNINRNDFRLITAVHYRKVARDDDGDEKEIGGRIYLFFLLTHAEYDKDFWKERL
jgi:mRNA-degrading endonuclease HigB of HigAB toxin-antitoxin module